MQMIRAVNCTHPADTQMLVCLVTSVLKIPCKLIRAPDTSAMTIPHIRNLRLLKCLSGTEYPERKKVMQSRYWIFNPVIVKQKKM